MKILFGVQGTGNGHISRARHLAHEFSLLNINVDWLFSGRPPEKYFDIEPFSNYSVKKGLTFNTKHGKVSNWRTLLSNNYAQLIRDIMTLDVSEYDVICSDFEPITAWAGKLKKKTVISLGHQPAFDYDIPVKNKTWTSSTIMKYFAPGQVRVGMHWHHYGQPILPPIVDTSLASQSKSEQGKILVYLPIEDIDCIRSLFSTFRDFTFYIYHPDAYNEISGNLIFKATSLNGFKHDFNTCSGVICNAGFELVSESLVSGKHLLVTPQKNQFEQASNAEALRQLKYAYTVNDLTTRAVRNWLMTSTVRTIFAYPNVARELAHWIYRQDYSNDSLQTLSNNLWKNVIKNDFSIDICR